MKTFVAFLRGINVGGKSLIKMADLKTAVERCGYTNVRTYIASGNVVFESAGNADAISERLETKLSKEFGILLRIVVFTKDNLAKVLKNAPKPWIDGTDLRRYLAFIRPPKTARDVLNEANPKEGIDSLEVGERVVYMSTKLSGITKSGLTKLISKDIYKDITIRNFTTAQKILALMEK